MIFKILFYAFLLYILYKLVFNFILPVYRTTKQVKRSFREMNERMAQQYGATGPARPQEPVSKPSGPGREKAGEYIDFEEV